MTLDPRAYERTKMLLQEATWLKNCSLAAIELLLRHARAIRFDKGQTLFRRGDRVDRFWIVLDGSLEMARVSADGRRLVTAYVPPGHAVALIPLIDGRGAIHDARAHVPSTCVSIPKVDFFVAMQTDLNLLESVLRLIAERGRQLFESRAEATTLPLAARLARLLLWLGATHGFSEDEAGRTIALRTSQDDLAAMLGVTRQALSPEIKAMERNRLLKLAYARVTVLDETALAMLAKESFD